MNTSQFLRTLLCSFSGVRFNPDSEGYGTVGQTPRRSANQNEEVGDVVVRSLDEDTSRYWWPSFTQWFVRNFYTNKFSLYLILSFKMGNLF